MCIQLFYVGYCQNVSVGLSQIHCYECSVTHICSKHTYLEVRPEWNNGVQFICLLIERI